MPRTQPKDKATLPTDSSEQNGKAHVPGDPESDLSSSDSSSNQYNLSNDTNYSKCNRKKRDMKKKRQKHKKQDSSDSSSSDSDSYDDSDYRYNRRKKKSHREKYLIKLCAGLTAKLLNQHINQRSLGSNWMRIRSSAGFFSHVCIITGYDIFPV